MSDVKHVKQEEYYEVTVRLTPDEYNAISKNASWEYGGDVPGYLAWCALGNRKVGC